MTSGVVVGAVSPQWATATLSADVATGQRVLPVVSARHFAEKFNTRRWLVIANSTTPLEYVASQRDDDFPQTVTLAADLLENLEAGLPITRWDPSSAALDKRDVDYVAPVQIDGTDVADAIPVGLDDRAIPTTGLASLVGARVSLVEDDEGGWWVDRVLGRTPEIGAAFISTPIATGVLLTSQAWADASWDTIPLNGSDRVNLGFNSTTRIFTVQEGQAGIYTGLLSVAFQPNSTNARGARFRLHRVDGSSENLPYVRFAAGSGTTALQVGCSERLEVGEGLSCEAYQSSTGSLNLLGSDVDPGVYGEVGLRPTSVKIYRSAS